MYQLPGAGRATVLLPRYPLIAGEPNKLFLEYGNYKGREVIIYWGRRLDGHVIWDRDAGRELGPLPIAYEPDGKPYINVFPMHPGEWQIRAIIVFTDGGIDTKDINVSIVLPETTPETLTATTSAIETSTIYMDLTHFVKDYMQVKAYYKGLDKGIEVPTKQLKFKMTLSPGASPPVRLDEQTGFLTALHPGHALLEISFNGVSTLECLDVVQDSVFGSVERCADLLPAGKKLPQSREDNRMTLAPPLITPRKK